MIERGVSPDASTETPLAIFPALAGDLPLAAFALPVPLPDAEGAFGRAALCRGARPAWSFSGPGIAIRDRVWEDGGPFLAGSEMVS